MSNTAILITGMKHSGKSTAGRIIARELSTNFTDLDDLIEEIYSDENGETLSCREIFQKGRTVFQDYEVKAARKLAGTHGIFTAAAGGGICDNQSACEKMKSFTWIYIEETPDLLFKRISAEGIPPFLNTEEPYADFIKLYNRRTPIYDKLCNIKITAAGRMPAEICSEIIEKLTGAGYGRK